MNTIFKESLSKINVDEELKNKTKLYIRNNMKGGNIMKKYFDTRKVAAIVAIVAFVVVTIFAIDLSKKTDPKTNTIDKDLIVSYVSVDINPSIELGLNELKEVVSVEAYNEDGKKVINELKLSGNTSKEAIKAIIKSANNLGYIAEDGSTLVAVTTETDDQELANELQEELEEGLELAEKEIEKEVQVQKENIGLELREEARKLGITPGKYNIIKKLQETDQNINIEDYKEESVKNIMNKIHENKGIGESNNNKSDNANNDNSNNENANNENANKDNPNKEEESFKN